MNVYSITLNQITTRISYTQTFTLFELLLDNDCSRLLSSTNNPVFTYITVVLQKIDTIVSSQLVFRNGYQTDWNGIKLSPSMSGRQYAVFKANSAQKNFGCLTCIYLLAFSIVCYSVSTHIRKITMPILSVLYNDSLAKSHVI